jgi:hypothetical protein
MLHHDLATTFVADRDRAIREGLRAHALPGRPSIVARVRAWMGTLVGRPEPRVTRTPRAIARDLGVAAVSASARDTHGQGAC